jgi:hypothetical protein
MERYICENVFVPLRSGPSHKTEMVSQLLFGEKFTKIDDSGHWIKVEDLYTRYSGWTDREHIQYSADNEPEKSHVLNHSLLCLSRDNTKMVLEAGCEIYNPDFEKKIFTIGTDVYNVKKEFSRSCVEASGTVCDTAMYFINSPYIWGGRIPSGIDCSEFTTLVTRYTVRQSRMTAGSNLSWEQILHLSMKRYQATWYSLIMTGGESHMLV